MLPRYGLGAAFGSIVLVLALVLMAGYFRAIRVTERFQVITGRGFRPRQVKLGMWRVPALAFVFGYFGLMLLPVFILLWASLRPFYSVPTLDGLRTLTLSNYKAVLDLATVQHAVSNTVILVIASATLTMVLAILVSWFSVRSPSRVARWVDALALTPMAIPGVVMGLAFMLIYIQTPLYGTIWIIVLAESVVGLAYATRTMNGALLQIHKDLENAAIACGAKWLVSLRTVLLPLLLPQILLAWLWVAAHSLRDLTIPLLLRTHDNMVVSSAMLQLWNTPNLVGASALAMLMIVGLMALVIPIQVYALRKE
jgi:iron(III) transport system permease protein